MALVAHIDSGKTTLTESILLSSSYLSTPGSVDAGSTTTDFLPAERERGITIQSASIPVSWKNWSFNLIDTPGHADFGMEVECASRVIDGAVVLIDSVEGVEAQTKGVWKQLDRYNVTSRIVFFNKLDRPGASFTSSLKSLLAHRLHPTPMPLALPIANFDAHAYTRAEPGIQGLVDLVKWEVWKWDEAGNSSRHPLPQDSEDLNGLPYLSSTHPLIPQLLLARSKLLDGLAMFSDELMDNLLGLPSGPASYGAVSPACIIPHLRAATLKGNISPVFCGSAVQHIGTELLMDYIGELFPSPLDVEHESQTYKSPLCLLAWKVTWNKQRGWMTFVRVYSGTLKRQSVILNATQNQRERVSKLLLLYASEAVEVDELPFGSVGVVLGLKYTRTGDTLVSVSKTSKSSLRDIVPLPPVISASIIPHSHSDLEPVQDALASLVRTDPSVRTDTQEGQLLVHGLGALHLEIVEGRLRDEWGVRFELGSRRVSYREGLGSGNTTNSSNTWKTDASGHSVNILVSLGIRPKTDEEAGDPIWDDNVVIDNNGNSLPSPESVSDDPWSCIARGISSTLSSSPHSSLPMTRIHIQVNSVEIPPNAPSSLLTGASAFILRSHIRNAGMGPLLEPYARLKVSIPEDSLGKVVKDLTEHGGEVLDLGDGASVSQDTGGFPEDGIYIPPTWISPSAVDSPGTGGSVLHRKRFIHAIAPLSQLLDYSSRLRALSGGHGTFELANAGFRIVSEARRMEILKEIGRA